MRIRLLSLMLIGGMGLPAQFSTFPGGDYFKEQWQRPPLDIEIETVRRLEDFYIDDRIQLSLRAYIELVIANSPDIQLQKLAVYEQQNAVQRAFGVFDPTVSAGFNANRSNNPSTGVLDGAEVRANLNQRGSLTYNKTMDTGTTYSVGFTGVKNANNSQFTNFNPSITHNLDFQITQPLLRGRGRFVNRVPILVARSQLDATGEQVRERVLGLLVQAENAYWDVVDQRESLRVRENNLELARAFLERSRRELELGAISPLDIYQPEQQYATAQVAVTQFQYSLQQAEDVVRRWIGADLDPRFRQIRLLLTETAEPPDQMPTYDPEQTVAKAMQMRPELVQSRYSLDIDDFDIRAATDELRPDLTLTANYSSQGRGGNFFERTLFGGEPTTTFIPGGYRQALDQLLGFNFPAYSFGLQLQLPLRNRRAAADLSDAQIRKKRDLYTLRSLEQQVRLEALNAVAGVEQSKAAIHQAGVARDFARKRLDAEQKKYDLGVTTAFLVLDAQDDLVQAEADLLAQSIAYRRSIVRLLQATGELLEARGVVLTYDDP